MSAKKPKQQGNVQTDKENQLRLPNGKPYKIDLAEAVRLRLVRGFSYQEIADKFNCSKSAVYDRISRLLKVLDDPEAHSSYVKNKTAILESVERVLIGDLVDPDRRKRASLNNVAYAFQQIYNAGRLEAGKSTENVDVHAQYEAHVGRQEDAGAMAEAIKARLAELGESV